jgi:hypothetical protein
MKHSELKVAEIKELASKANKISIDLIKYFKDNNIVLFPCQKEKLDRCDIIIYPHQLFFDEYGRYYSGVVQSINNGKAIMYCVDNNEFYGTIISIDISLLFFDTLIEITDFLTE